MLAGSRGAPRRRLEGEGLPHREKPRHLHISSGTTFRDRVVASSQLVAQTNCNRSKPGKRAAFGMVDRRSASGCEPPPAARALTAVPALARDCRERIRLRQGHDRPERQRKRGGAVMTIRNPADRMAQDLDR